MQHSRSYLAKLALVRLFCALGLGTLWSCIVGEPRLGLPCSDMGLCPSGQVCELDVCVAEDDVNPPPAQAPDAGDESDVDGGTGETCDRGTPPQEASGAGFVRTLPSSLEFVMDAAGGPHRVEFGSPGDVPIIGDWDGDGFDQPGVVRDSGTPDAELEFLLMEDGGIRRVLFGQSNDIPIVGDWNQDGRTNVGTVRPAGNTLEWSFRIPDGIGGFVTDTRFYGDNTIDSPTTGDWNGDGKTDIAVTRDVDGLLQHILSVDEGGETDRINFGDPSIDTVVVTDWDGDGSDDIGVTRTATERAFLYESGGVVNSVIFGGPSDVPIAGNWAAVTRTCD